MKRNTFFLKRSVSQEIQCDLLREKGLLSPVQRLNYSGLTIGVIDVEQGQNKEKGASVLL